MRGCGSTLRTNVARRVSLKPSTADDNFGQEARLASIPGRLSGGDPGVARGGSGSEGGVFRPASGGRRAVLPSIRRGSLGCRRTRGGRGRTAVFIATRKYYRGRYPRDDRPAVERGRPVHGGWRRRHAPGPEDASVRSRSAPRRE